MYIEYRNFELLNGCVEVFLNYYLLAVAWFITLLCAILIVEILLSVYAYLEIKGDSILTAHSNFKHFLEDLIDL